MAKSKTVTKTQTIVVEAPVTTNVANGSPYQLDPTQVDRAAKALVSHMKKHVEEKDEKAAVKNLADDEDEAEDNEQPIFLSVNTKKYISDSKSLKPTKMLVCSPTMRVYFANIAAAPSLTPSSPTTYEYAYSQRTRSARTKTSSRPMPSQLPSAKRSFGSLV
jgi:hypothetical protein